VPSLPTDFTSLAAVVFLLGMRHGLDADHLATIDGLTRFGRRAGAAHARYAGALFSLGHGTVVIAIAALVGGATAHWRAPGWLEAGGAWTSILVLSLLGVINLRAVFNAGPDEVVAPVGLKGRYLGRLIRVHRPWVVMAVGALFALSFDTVSQAILFAVTGAQFGGLGDAVLLGFAFLAGMLLTDGCNGLFIARLIERSDALARVASRVMGLAVGGVSLLVALLGTARLVAPAFAAWSEGRELAFGAAVIGIVTASFIAGRALARRGEAALQAG
jgi:nickel/cobalt transporter (NiCoT) family protein